MNAIIDDSLIPKNFIKWDSKLETGIPVVDEQHRHLVELCRTLHDDLMDSGSKDESHWKAPFTAALKECAAYVHTHFSTEEKLMLAAHFDGYAHHKAEHDAFTMQVVENISKFSKASFVDAMKFVRFLYEWILNHVAHEDKLFVQPLLDYYNIEKAPKSSSVPIYVMS